jgi:DMSO reductase anchor subunit
MFYEPRAVPLLAALTVVAGVAGVGSSARVYMVPGRPSWNSGYTAAEFALTSIVMGILFLPLFPNSSGGLRYAGLAAGLAIMLTTAAKFFRLHRSRRHELRATARLLSTVLATHLFWRIALMAAALAVAYSAGGRWSAIAALLLAAGSELLGRYLFFVSVVPTNIAAGYLAAQEAA